MEQPSGLLDELTSRPTPARADRGRRDRLRDARANARPPRPARSRLADRAFALGIALLVVAVASPIAEVGEEELFAFHMAQHLLIGDLAPLCLLAGLTGPLLRPLLALPGVMRLRVLANPFVASRSGRRTSPSGTSPVLYEAAVENGAVHALEHAAFFTAGIVLWLPVLETLPAPEWFGDRREARLHRRRPARRDADRQRLRLGRRPFYDVYEAGDEYLGLSPSATRASPAR